MHKKKISTWGLFTLLAATCSAKTFSEVTAVGPSGFVSEHTLTLQGNPDDVYEALTKNIHRWWDAEHSYSGRADNFNLDASAGGCFCESLPGGGEVEHMRVVFANPGKGLRLQGGLGPLQEMAVNGSMTFNLTAADNGTTQLTYRYIVGGYVPGGLEFIAEPVDRVQLGQLQRLQAFLADK